jgi:hypothetical protein
LPQLITEVGCFSLVIEIGGVPIRINTTSQEFQQTLQDRYAGFIGSQGGTLDSSPQMEFDVELSDAGFGDSETGAKVSQTGGVWRMQRGDFRAEWEPKTHQGKIRQPASPYAIDAVLRIVHTLALARQGGILLHAASAIRDGKAFVFAGVSGAGKTTISRLAPNDVTLLTDEISYVRKMDNRYVCFGTPFTGELAKLGENVSGPLEAVYLLAQGSENRIEPVSAPDAVRSMLANVLFFAEEPELVREVFHSVCELVDRVPVSRLTFVPDSRVWEIIR